MPTYQWEPDDDVWQAWKDTVPRSKPLHERLDELLQADIDGRVLPPGGDRDDEPAPVEPTPEPEPPQDDEIARAVELGSQDWDDSPERLEARREAARAVLAALRDEPMSKGEIVDRFAEEYAVEGQSERTWWRKSIKSEQTAHDGPIDQVAAYSPSSQKYEWFGLDE